MKAEVLEVVPDGPRKVRYTFDEPGFGAPFEP